MDIHTEHALEKPLEAFTIYYVSVIIHYFNYVTVMKHPVCMYKIDEMSTIDEFVLIS